MKNRMKWPARFLFSLARGLPCGRIDKHPLAEKEMREKDGWVRSLLENVHMFAVGLDLEGKITYANPFLLNLTRYSREEVLGKSWYQTFIHEEARQVAKGALQWLLQEGTASHCEYSILTKSGEKRLTAWNNTVLWDHDDQPIGLICIGEDITERRRAEDQIRAALEEKVVLLKEIHHRVKNNMQIVSSLLRLQSRYLRNEEAQKVFQNSQNRIKTMALIHERLYRSRDFSRIDFARYVEDLAANLYHCYGANAEAIPLKICGQEIFLGMDKAIPCGLIVNELVSNSLKHAFPGREKGEIQIALTAEADKITLKINDNGAGLPPHVDPEKPESFGLELVTALVEQLDGTMELGNNGGAEFRITFPERQQKRGYMDPALSP